MRKLVVIVASVLFAALSFAPAALADDSVPMYRLYNPNSGEHFYSSSLDERNSLIHVGWRYEGTGWNAPTSGDPVYRLYNANGSEHHYTLDAVERDALVAAGWSYEGVGWYSSDKGTLPIYRQYNLNAFSCNHNYTISEDENGSLASVGWKEEGIAWRGFAPPSHDECFTTVTTDYYRVDIPKDWLSVGANPSYDVKDGLRYANGAPNLGIGCSTTIKMNNGYFYIECYTDNWGTQGDYTVRALGTPSNLPGWHVTAFTEYEPSGRNTPANMMPYLDEFASFITLY